MHIYVLTNTAEYNCVAWKHGEWILRIAVVQLSKWRICIAIGPMLPATRPSQSDSPSWNKKEATRLLTRELAIWWDVAQSSGNRPLTDFVSWVTMCSIGPDLVQKLFSGHICTARSIAIFFVKRIFGFQLFSQLGTKRSTLEWPFLRELERAWVWELVW